MQISERESKISTASVLALMYTQPQDPEDVGAGYGYSNAEGFAEDVFFYHSDHLGSTSYVTDGDGNATQFVAYTSFGESLVDEHAVTYESPYKFNGKEMDAETGLYYYGARYYDPSLALWYGVDALAEKYPSLGGYVYCANNPVRLIDPDGRKPLTANDRKKAEESRLLCYKMAFSYLESAEISQCQDVQAKLQYMALSNDRLKKLFNIKNIDDIDSKKTENRLYWLYSDVFENRYENTDK